MYVRTYSTYVRDKPSGPCVGLAGGRWPVKGSAGMGSRSVLQGFQRH